MYSSETLEHFQNPRNYGRMDDPDAVGLAGNPVCGDVMKIYLKIGKNDEGEEIIKDIKFETFGCVAAISVSSSLTEIAKGKTLKEALKISNQAIVESLGGLPPAKIHCSVLGEEALGKAIEDYQSKNNSGGNL